MRDMVRDTVPNRLPNTLPDTVPNTVPYWIRAITGGKLPPVPDPTSDRLLRSRPGVAAFDFDRTLSTRDCVLPFLRWVNGSVRTAAGLGWRVPRLLPAVLRRDRDALKALAASVVFAGRRHADVNHDGRRFAEHVVDSWIRPHALALLRGHQARGRDVVLVSASFGAYLHPIGDRLGVTAVLCTELAVDAEGCCTGALDGRNCRGDEKRARLDEWLAGRHGGRDRVELWAYGDSAGDVPLLRSADHAYWLGSPRRLPAGMTAA
jgi:phosphatidylglycerophosphatase C